MASYYSSGNWKVREGSEEEFVKRWTEFVELGKDDVHGKFVLIRENDDPRHFVSIGTWSSPEDIQAWMTSPRFLETRDVLAGLCDEFHGAAYSQVVSVE